MMRSRSVRGVEVSLFAGIRVRDLAASRGWYERLLGEPAFAPNDVELVWQLAAERFVYIEQDPDRAGDGLVTVFVDDLDGWLSRIAARGLEPAEVETYGNGVRKALFRDPDGNEVGIGGPPAAA